MHVVIYFVTVPTEELDALLVKAAGHPSDMSSTVPVGIL
jgi:hypothetical protein